jgi:hypothetical protein
MHMREGPDQGVRRKCDDGDDEQHGHGGGKHRRAPFGRTHIVARRANPHIGDVPYSWNYVPAGEWQRGNRGFEFTFASGVEPRSITGGCKIHCMSPRRAATSKQRQVRPSGDQSKANAVAAARHRGSADEAPPTEPPPTGGAWSRHLVEVAEFRDARRPPPATVSAPKSARRAFRSRRVATPQPRA